MKIRTWGNVRSILPDDNILVDIRRFSSGNGPCILLFVIIPATTFGFFSVETKCHLSIFISISAFVFPLSFIYIVRVKNQLPSFILLHICYLHLSILTFLVGFSYIKNFSPTYLSFWTHRVNPFESTQFWQNISSIYPTTRIPQVPS